MDYLFFLAQLKQRAVLVVGGGIVAARKINMLKRAGAIIRIVADMLCPELEKMNHSYHDLIWISKTFKENMLNDVFLVIVATDDRDLNSVVYRAAEKYHTFINVVDDRSKCSLIFPAIIDRSPILIGISSCGKAPVLVRILREKLESLLPVFLGNMAALAGKWRNRVKKHIFSSINRRKFWEKIFHNNLFNVLIARGLFKQANCLLEDVLYNKNIIKKELTGSVALVGAGPGDSGLFTLRGLQIVQEADVVLYDYLVSEEILNLIRRDAHKICVGKQYGNKKNSMAQNDINHLLITLAKKGNKVVRLKGGDPFIFGRGGEELEEIAMAGIPYQVVPGVTSASAISICADIPLTHRDYAHSVIFITGYYLVNSYYNNVSCYSLGDPNQTIVIYMGKVLSYNISKILIAYGCDSNTPVAVISRGTYPDQKISVGILKNLDILTDTSLNPSLLVIGRVVKFRNKINCLNKEYVSSKYRFSSLINLF